MQRYIAVKKAIEAIMDLPNCPNGYSDTYDKACIIGMLEEVPTADVVEVVRCKDCKFRGHIQLCPFGKRAMPHENGYCCYGERREDE